MKNAIFTIEFRWRHLGWWLRFHLVAHPLVKRYFRRADWPEENAAHLAAPMAAYRGWRLLTPGGIRREVRLLKLYTASVG